MISRANTRELVGRAAVAHDQFPYLMLCDKLYRLRLSSDCDADFLALYFSTSAARSQIELHASGASASMVNIAQSVILEMPFTCPGIDHQHRIVEYVKEATRSLDQLIENALKAVELLQERRTALISAAVTGKIDVHHLANKEAA